MSKDDFLFVFYETFFCWIKLKYYIDMQGILIIFVSLVVVIKYLLKVKAGLVTLLKTNEGIRTKSVFKCAMSNSVLTNTPCGIM